MIRYDLEPSEDTAIDLDRTNEGAESLLEAIDDLAALLGVERGIIFDALANIVRRRSAVERLRGTNRLPAPYRSR